MKENYKRRNYFVKKELQGRYLFGLFLMVIVGCIFFVGILSLMSMDKMSISYSNHNLQIGRTPFILLKEILNAQLTFVLIGGVVVILLALFLTHRLAGPIYRIEKTFEVMLLGDHSAQIYPRKHDELKEISNIINLYNEKTSKDLREMKETVADLRVSLTKASESNATNEARNEITKALGMTIKLSEKLSVYKLKNDSQHG